MKHLKSFNESIESDIDSICKKYKIKDYIINSDGYIDVDWDVDLSRKNLTKLPLKFNKVSGSFYCFSNQLTTLEGSPKEVGGSFGCSYNQLTSLEGGPKEVSGYFNCDNNQLTSLEGGPTKLRDDFYCDRNPLPDIILNSKYLKQILLEGDDFYICKNGKLDMSSFEYMIDIFKDEE